VEISYVTEKLIILLNKSVFIIAADATNLAIKKLYYVLIKFRT